MPRPKILGRVIINKPADEVIRALKQEGWPVVKETDGKVLFRHDKDVQARISKSAYN
jgi:predicted RNA binding protein YcfA (HicA-like mRNA interferase family)